MKLYIGTELHSRLDWGGESGQCRWKRIWSRNGESLVHVLGRQFGPDLLVVGCTVAQALDVLDELYGVPVDPDDLNLRDYGSNPEDALAEAVAKGDARYSDSGPVWVDHYEWIQSFATPREAGAWIRSQTSQRLEVVR